MQAIFTVLGITDEVSTCDCCGKKNLKRTVALEDFATLNIVYYGVDCAGKALRRKGSRPSLEAQFIAEGKQARNARISAEINDLVQAGALRMERSAYVQPGMAAGSMQAAAQLAATWPSLFEAPHSPYNPQLFIKGLDGKRAGWQAGINWAR